MNIPGGQQLLTWSAKQVTLKILFELVDDPDDSPEDRERLKPVNVWFTFMEKPVPAPLPPNAFYKAEHVIVVPNITKQTPRDVREFGWTTFKVGEKGVYLYVLAEPTKEWAHLYGTRQYEVKVFTGRTYNIAVSIPPLNAGANLQAANTDLRETGETVPGAREPKLNL